VLFHIVSVIFVYLCATKKSTMSEKKFNMNISLELNIEGNYNKETKTFRVPDFSNYSIKSGNINLKDFPEPIETVHIPSVKNMTYHIDFPDTVKTLSLLEQFANPLETLNLKHTKIKALEFSYVYGISDKGVDGEMLPEGLVELEISNVKSIKNFDKLKNLLRLKINDNVKFEDGCGLPQGLISLSAPYKVIQNLQKKNLLPRNLKELRITISGNTKVDGEYKIPASVETFEAMSYQADNYFKVDYKNSNLKHLNLTHCSLGGGGLDGEMLPESLESLKFAHYLPNNPIKNLHLLPNLKALNLSCAVVDYLVVDGEMTLPENLEYLEVNFKLFQRLCAKNKCPKNLKTVALFGLYYLLGNEEYKDFKFPEHIQNVFGMVSSSIEDDMFEKRFSGIRLNPKDVDVSYFNIHF